MNLIAIIPSGQTEITVNGLHQWDYGRKLEIHSTDFPATVEVHFACAGMDMAVVRACESVDGVAIATIPDKCLEQTTPIVAWVFEIDGTTGVTTKKINMPVEARPRPSRSDDLPQVLSDRYTELITAVNGAVANLNSGNVKVNKAAEADHATKADAATKADTATNATNANKATRATNADQATNANYASLSGHADTADEAEEAKALTLTEVSYGDITSTSQRLSAELSYGRAYLISAQLSSQDADTRSTFFLYTSSGTTAYSTSTKEGAYIGAYYASGTWELIFYNSGNAPTTALDITIREI